MVLEGVRLGSIAVVVRDYSAETLFPFNLTCVGGAEVNIKHLVLNLFSLMWVVEVVVIKPLFVNVVQMIKAETDKVVKALFLTMAMPASAYPFAWGVRGGVLTIFVSIAFQISSNEKAYLVSLSRIR